MTVITIATSKGGAGKTTLARLILSRAAIDGISAAGIDTDINHALVDWAAISEAKMVVRSETDEAKIVPLVEELKERHDLVVIDTAGAKAQATIYAFGCSDLVLVPVMQSATDVEEARKTVEKVRAASRMVKWEIPHRVVVMGATPGTNIAAHIEQEIATAGLPVLRTRLHRLVAFLELSYTGTAPTHGHAGYQCSCFLDDLTGLGVYPEARNMTL